MPSRILTVAGSDPSGGAGIQADIKTITALGGYAMSAVTAVTVQDTLRIYDVIPVEPKKVAAQINCVLNDIGADVIKTGMLHSAGVVSALFDILSSLKLPISLIVDPVILSTSGHALLCKEGVSLLIKKIFPFITLLTPNLAEAAVLSGLKVVANLQQMEDAGKILLSQGLGLKSGGGAVLIKGGHLEGEDVSDMLLFHKNDRLQKYFFSSQKQNTRNTHGTGCSLASAIAVKYADLKRSVFDPDALCKASEFAHHYVANAIKTAPNLGKGKGPLNHIL